MVSEYYLTKEGKKESHLQLGFLEADLESELIWKVTQGSTGTRVGSESGRERSSSGRFNVQVTPVNNGSSAPLEEKVGTPRSRSSSKG